MEYKHSCVIDAENYYKTLVLVFLEPSGVENIQYYTLGENESLLDVKPPTEYVRAKWNGTDWEEGATPEEIEQWEKDHPAPPTPGPSETELLREQVAALQEQINILTGGATE